MIYNEIMILLFRGIILDLWNGRESQETETLMLEWMEILLQSKIEMRSDEIEFIVHNCDLLMLTTPKFMERNIQAPFCYSDNNDAVINVVGTKCQELKLSQMCIVKINYKAITWLMENNLGNGE